MHAPVPVRRPASRLRPALPGPVRLLWAAAALLAAGAAAGPALAQGAVNGNPGGSTVITTSVHEELTFLAPTTVNQQASAYATEIIGRLAGGAALLDVTVLDAFDSAGVQAALASARAALLAAGGPGTAIASPALLSSATATSSANTTLYSLEPSFITGTYTGQYAVTTSTQTFGPGTVNGYISGQSSTAARPGLYSTCSNVGSTPAGTGNNDVGLPSTTKPTCSPVDGGTLTLLPGQLDTNSDTIFFYPINTTTTVTDTTTLTQAYVLVGTPAAAPTGVPEPAGWTVLAAGLAALGLLAPRRAGA